MTTGWQEAFDRGHGIGDHVHDVEAAHLVLETEAELTRAAANPYPCCTHCGCNPGVGGDGHPTPCTWPTCTEKDR